MTQDVHEQHSIVDQLLAELKRTYYAGQRPTYAQLKLIAPSLSLEDYKRLVQRFMEFMREQELQLFKDQEQQLTQTYPYIPEHITEDLLYFEQEIFSQFSRFLMQRDQSIAQSVASEMEQLRKQVMNLTRENASLQRENHKLQVQISALENSLSRLDESYQFECKAHQQALVELNKLRESDGAGLLFVKLLKQHLDSPDFAKLSHSLSSSTAEALIALLKRADLDEAKKDLASEDNAQAQAQAEYAALLDPVVDKDSELTDELDLESGNATQGAEEADELEPYRRSLSVESELSRFRNLKFDDLSSLQQGANAQADSEQANLHRIATDLSSLPPQESALPSDFVPEQLGLDSSQDDDESLEQSAMNLGMLPAGFGLAQGMLGQGFNMPEGSLGMLSSDILNRISRQDSLAKAEDSEVDTIAPVEPIEPVDDENDGEQVEDSTQLHDLTDAAQRLPKTDIAQSETKEHNEAAIKAALAAIISTEPFGDPSANHELPSTQVLNTFKQHQSKAWSLQNARSQTLDNASTQLESEYAQKIDALYALQVQLFESKESSDITPMEVESLVSAALAQQLFTPQQERECRKLVVKLLFLGREAVSAKDATADIDAIVQDIPDEQLRFLAKALLSWRMPHQQSSVAEQAHNLGQAPSSEQAYKQEQANGLELSNVPESSNAQEQSSAQEAQVQSAANVAIMHEAESNVATNAKHAQAPEQGQASEEGQASEQAQGYEQGQGHEQESLLSQEQENSSSYEQPISQEQALVQAQEQIDSHEQVKLNTQEQADAQLAKSQETVTSDKQQDELATTDSTHESTQPLQLLEDEASSANDTDDIIKFEVDDLSAVQEEQDSELKLTAEAESDSSEASENVIAFDFVSPSQQSSANLTKTKQPKVMFSMQEQEQDSVIADEQEQAIEAEQEAQVEEQAQAGSNEQANEQVQAGFNEQAQVGSGEQTNEQVQADSNEQAQAGSEEQAESQVTVDKTQDLSASDVSNVGQDVSEQVTAEHDATQVQDSSEQKAEEPATSQSTQDGNAQESVVSEQATNKAQDSKQSATKMQAKSLDPSLANSDGDIGISIANTPLDLAALAMTWGSQPVAPQAKSMASTPTPVVPKAQANANENKTVDKAAGFALQEQDKSQQDKQEQQAKSQQAKPEQVEGNVAQAQSNATLSNTNDVQSVAKSQEAQALNANTQNNSVEHKNAERAQAISWLSSAGLMREDDMLSVTPVSFADLLSSAIPAHKQSGSGSSSNENGPTLSKVTNIQDLMSQGLNHPTTTAQCLISKLVESTQAAQVLNSESEQTLAKSVDSSEQSASTEQSNEQVSEAQGSEPSTEQATEQSNAQSTEQSSEQSTTSSEAQSPSVSTEVSDLSNAQINEQASVAQGSEQKAEQSVAEVQGAGAESEDEVFNKFENLTKEQAIQAVMQELAEHRHPQVEVLNAAPRSLIRDESTLVKEIGSKAGDDSIAAFAAATAKVESIAPLLSENKHALQHDNDITFNFNQGGTSIQHVGSIKNQQEGKATAELAKVAQDVLKVASELEAKSEQELNLQKQSSIFAQSYDKGSLDVAGADEANDFVSGNTRNEGDLLSTSKITSLNQGALDKSSLPQDNSKLFLQASDKSKQDLALGKQYEPVEQSTSTSFSSTESTAVSRTVSSDNQLKGNMTTLSSNEATLITSSPVTSMPYTDMSVNEVLSRQEALLRNTAMTTQEAMYGPQAAKQKSQATSEDLAKKQVRFNEQDSDLSDIVSGPVTKEGGESSKAQELSVAKSLVQEALAQSEQDKTQVQQDATSLEHEAIQWLNPDGASAAEKEQTKTESSNALEQVTQSDELSFSISTVGGLVNHTAQEQSKTDLVGVEANQDNAETQNSATSLNVAVDATDKSAIANAETQVEQAYEAEQGADKDKSVEQEAEAKVEAKAEQAQEANQGVEQVVEAEAKVEANAEQAQEANQGVEQVVEAEAKVEANTEQAQGADQGVEQEAKAEQSTDQDNVNTLNLTQESEASLPSTATLSEQESVASPAASVESVTELNAQEQQSLQELYDKVKQLALQKEQSSKEHSVKNDKAETTVESSVFYQEALQEVESAHTDLSERLKIVLHRRIEEGFFPSQAVLESSHNQNTAQLVAMHKQTAVSKLKAQVAVDSKTPSPALTTAKMDAKATAYQDLSVKSVADKLELQEQAKEATAEALNKEDKAEALNSEGKAEALNSEGKVLINATLAEQVTIKSQVESAVDGQKGSQQAPTRQKKLATATESASGVASELEELMPLNEQEEMEPPEGPITFALDPNFVMPDDFSGTGNLDSGMFSLVQDDSASLKLASPPPVTAKKQVTWHSRGEKNLERNAFIFDPKPQSLKAKEESATLQVDVQPKASAKVDLATLLNLSNSQVHGGSGFSSADSLSKAHAEAKAKKPTMLHAGRLTLDSSYLQNMAKDPQLDSLTQAKPSTSSSSQLNYTGSWVGSSVDSQSSFFKAPFDIIGAGQGKAAKMLASGSFSTK